MRDQGGTNRGKDFTGPRASPAPSRRSSGKPTQAKGGKGRSPGELALSLIDKSSDELDLAKQLKASGMKLTPANMAEVKAALDQRRNEVNVSASADQ